MPANHAPKTENLEKFVKVCKSIGPVEAILGVPLDEEDRKADPELASYVTAFFSAVDMVVQRTAVAYNVKSRGILERFTKKQQEALMDPAKMAEAQAEADKE